MPFEFKSLGLEGVRLVTPKVFGDERGFFMETYARKDFEPAGIRVEFVQQNHSRSVRGVLRGLHFQREPYSQAKLVRCISGEVLDVAVDVRKGSKDFGRHVTAVLSEENKHIIFVPRGFAHGFLTISDVAEVEYMVDNVYAPAHEAGVIWNDPRIGVDWSISEPTLSDKDKRWPGLSEL